MIRTARRNSIVVLVALCVPLLIFAVMRGRETNASYVSRCGPDYRLFLLCCCAAAAIACAAAAAGLVYSARKRARGHPLNGITYTWAGFAASVGILALSPFLNLRSAPCVVTPILYSLVAGGASLAAIHTVRRMPELTRVPNFEIEQMAEAVGRAATITHDPILFEAQRFIESYRQSREGG
jgi:hypothetical protein